jgi:hypothetical protein
MNTQHFDSAPSDCYQQSTQSIVLLSWWNRVCDRFMTRLFQHLDPVVTEKRDANGSYWQIYDPETNESVCVRSQQEARIWLEQRYLQSPKTSFN